LTGILFISGKNHEKIQNGGMIMKKINFHKVCELDFTFNDTELFIPTVGREGDLFILHADEKPVNHMYDHSIIHCTSKENKIYQLPCDKQYVEVQRMGDYWLCLDGYPFNDFDKNMTVYSSKGKELYRFAVGCGVTNWQVDQKDQIWLTYSEVGVFGLLEISQHGLVCLNSKGEVVEAPLDGDIGQGKIPAMIDGTALDVTKDGSVWFNYDSGKGYCLVKLREGQIEYFTRGLMDHIQPIQWITQTNQTLMVGNSQQNIYAINLGESNVMEQIILVDWKGQPVNFDWLGAKGRTIWGVSGNKVYICLKQTF
jgi:hypothetical protein